MLRNFFSIYFSDCYIVNSCECNTGMAICWCIRVYSSLLWVISPPVIQLFCNSSTPHGDEVIFVHFLQLIDLMKVI